MIHAYALAEIFSVAAEVNTLSLLASVISTSYKKNHFLQNLDSFSARWGISMLGQV